MSSNINNNERIAKNTLFLFLRMILVLCVGLFTSRIILNVLGVEDFGIYNVVASIVILFTFLQQALTNATSRFITYALGKCDIEEVRYTFSTSMNAHFLLSIIIIFLSETIGLCCLNKYLVIPEDRVVAANIAYQFSIIGFCASVIRTPYNSAIIAEEKMNFFAYISIAEVVLKLIAVYLLLIVELDKLVLYSAFVCIINIFILVWNKIYCTSHFVECHYIRCWRKDSLISMVKYSGWSIVVNGTDVCVNQSLVYFFNIFFGVVANAALGIATQVNTYLTQFLNSFTQAYTPQIIKSYASGDRNYFYKLIFSSSKISFYLLFFISMPILFNIRFILKLWLGEVPPDTEIFVIMMLMFSLVDAYSAPLWNAVYATGNLRNHQLLMASIKVINIPLAFFLLKFGLPAWLALLTKALLNVICSIARPIYVKGLFQLPLKHYFIDVFVIVYLVSVVSLAIPVIICWYFESGIYRLLFSSLSFILFALPTIWFIGLTVNEKQLVKNLILSKFK